MRQLARAILIMGMFGFIRSRVRQATARRLNRTCVDVLNVLNDSVIPLHFDEIVSLTRRSGIMVSAAINALYDQDLVSSLTYFDPDEIDHGGPYLITPAGETSLQQLAWVVGDAMAADRPYAR